MKINSEKLWEQLRGRSAYELAVINGFTGTQDEYLDSLTAYGIAIKDGYTGTAAEWLHSLTAYGVAVKNGYKGTEADWLISLKGPIGGDTTIYSLSEIPVNKVWLDNRQIYRKVVDIGALTNISLKSIAHEIANIAQVTDFVVIVRDANNTFASVSKRANVLDDTTVESDIDVKITNTHIQIYSSQNNTDKNAVAIIEFTKTTDKPLTADELEQIGQRQR